MQLSKEEREILEKYINYAFPFAEAEHIESKINDFIKHDGNPWKAINEES